MTNLEIQNAYVGNAQVSKIYLGADVIYSGGSPGPTPSYLVVTLYDSFGQSTADTFSNGIIPDRQYENRSDIVRVVIGSGITSIGSGDFSYVFAGCGNLTSVTIGDDVVYIGGRAFENTPSLYTITIPASVTGIGTNAFYEFDWAHTITFEGDLPYMSMAEDWDLGDGTNLIVPDIYLSNYCSFNSSHNNKYNIESDLGNRCSGGGSPAGPYEVVWVDNFGQTHTDDYSNEPFPDNLKVPDEQYHYNLGFFDDMTDAYISDTFEDIGRYAFADNINLTAVTIGSGIFHIDNQAFEGTSIQTVTIPARVNGIGKNAFNAHIGEMIFEGTTPPQLLDDIEQKTLGGNDPWDTRYPIYVPDQAYFDYLQDYSTYSSRIHPISDRQNNI